MKNVKLYNNLHEQIVELSVKWSIPVQDVLGTLITMALMKMDEREWGKYYGYLKQGNVAE